MKAPKSTGTYTGAGVQGGYFCEGPCVLIIMCDVCSTGVSDTLLESCWRGFSSIGEAHSFKGRRAERETAEGECVVVAGDATALPSPGVGGSGWMATLSRAQRFVQVCQRVCIHMVPAYHGVKY